jgi:hypothetical protein
MDYSTYKVVFWEYVGVWAIEAHCFGKYQYTLEIEFDNEEMANKVCKILNEEVKEAFGDGQISTI